MFTPIPALVAHTHPSTGITLALTLLLTAIRRTLQDRAITARKPRFDSLERKGRVEALVDVRVECERGLGGGYGGSLRVVLVDGSTVSSSFRYIDRSIDGDVNVGHGFKSGCGEGAETGALAVDAETVAGTAVGARLLRAVGAAEASLAHADALVALAIA